MPLSVRPQHSPMVADGVRIDSLWGSYDALNSPVANPSIFRLPTSSAGSGSYFAEPIVLTFSVFSCSYLVLMTYWTSPRGTWPNAEQSNRRIPVARATPALLTVTLETLKRTTPHPCSLRRSSTPQLSPCRCPLPLARTGPNDTAHAINADPESWDARRATASLANDAELPE